MSDIYIDTDCLCSFVRTHHSDLIKKVYPDSTIFVPNAVHLEIINPAAGGLESLRNSYYLALTNKDVVLAGSFTLDSPEYLEYLTLTNRGDGGKIIGAGEAAAIVHVKHNPGSLLASNNLRDILFYVRKYSITHITTEVILLEALRQGIINENMGEKIWQKMLACHRTLPFKTFKESIENSIKHV
ncbi:MAG: hypothetical protein NTV44_05795 [Firmicutes bacterium]|nr:hypothetical protein [Bacillota bacterium]